MNFVFIIQFVFFSMAIILTCLNINERFYTNRTSSKIAIKPYSQIKFPVYLSVIPENAFNMTKLQKNGYKHASRYFHGYVTDSHNIYNWSTIENSLNETFYGLCDFPRIEDLIDIIKLDVTGSKTPRFKEVKPQDLLLTTTFYYPAIRFTLNISLGVGETLHALTIEAKNYSSLRFILEDKESFTNRILMRNLEPLNLPMRFESDYTGVKEFSATFSQVHLSPEDETYNCSNYDDDSLYKSFAECEDHYIRQTLPSGMIPPWSLPIANLSMASKHYSDNNTQFMSDLWVIADNLLIGHKNSDCPLPCKSTQTKVMMTAEMESAQRVAYITFAETVKVEEITVDHFQFMESLNFLGSNLGLWPGLGIFQLVEGGIGLMLALSFINKLKVFLNKRIF